MPVLCPHDNEILPDRLEAGYANPHTDIPHIAHNNKRDDFNVGTIVHELMHLWAYQNVKQEDRLATYLLTHFDTHNGRSALWVAWHEAFAESMSNELIREIFGAPDTIYGGDPAERRPYSRAFLQSRGIATKADLDFFEDGWASILGLLLNPNPCYVDMSGTGRYADSNPPPSGDSGWTACTSPRIGWTNILKAVANAGTQHDGGLSRGAMRMTPFFRRIADEVPEFTEHYQEAFAAILDPQETRTARDPLTIRAHTLDYRLRMQGV